MLDFIILISGYVLIGFMEKNTAYGVKDHMQIRCLFAEYIWEGGYRPQYHSNICMVICFRLFKNKKMNTFKLYIYFQDLVCTWRCMKQKLIFRLAILPTAMLHIIYSFLCQSLFCGASVDVPVEYFFSYSYTE